MSAKMFAYYHHRGQVRKYTGEPYIVHPAAVVRIVKQVSDSKAMLQAAWLHDTVEDTEATLVEIRALFGDAVARYVDELTDTTTLQDGNRAKRKAAYCSRLAYASPEAQTIKLADLIDNSASILAHDKKFAKVFIPEMKALFGVLDSGDFNLRVQAARIIEKAEKELL